MLDFKRIVFISLILLSLSSQPPVLGGEPNWVDGTHELIARAHRMITISDRAQLRAPSAGQQILLGEQRKFCAVDFSRSGSSYLTTATCRSIGKFCYIFVEDAQWQRGTVTNTGVARLRKAFDESTPRDPSRGIYELETESFGLPPDELDLDPKIYILVLDIPDGYNARFVAGYFEPMNQKRGVLRDPETGSQFLSNEVELLYIDADPLDISDVEAGEVLAHELQHLIHWRHDPDESLWINEGCSDYASLFLCGYAGNRRLWRVEAFEQETQTSLVYWPISVASSPASYGAAYLWMVYLHEHYGGVSTISSLIAQPANGINGVNAVLSSCGYSERFEDVFSDWKVANYLDDTYFASGKYGYRSLSLNVRCNVRHSSFPVSNTSRSVQSWAADYIEFTAGNKVSDLQIDFSALHNFDVKVVMLKNGIPVDVESMRVQPGSVRGRFSVSKFGSSADTVVLIPNWQPRAEADFDQIVSYSYSARLGDETSPKVTVLTNPVNQSYVDIIAQFVEDIGVEVPKVTITRAGKTLMSSHAMVPAFSFLPKCRVYVYQLFVPRDWDRSEVIWEIFYLGQSVAKGSLEGK